MILDFFDNGSVIAICRRYEGIRVVRGTRFVAIVRGIAEEQRFSVGYLAEELNSYNCMEM